MKDYIFATLLHFYFYVGLFSYRLLVFILMKWLLLHVLFDYFVFSYAFFLVISYLFSYILIS